MKNKLKISIVLMTGDQKPMEFEIEYLKISGPGNLFRIVLTDGTERSWPLSQIQSVH